MAFGISPRKVITIPLGNYSPDHYLTLLYHAFKNLGWRISYFNRDGIIGYTPISWESYAEEVSARIEGNNVIIKSECVGYQFFFTDYGKNAKNLELLLDGEIEYVEYHLKENLHETTQQLIDSIPKTSLLIWKTRQWVIKKSYATFCRPLRQHPAILLHQLWCSLTS